MTAINGISGSAGVPAFGKTRATDGVAEGFASIIEKFKEEAAKTPAEKARDQVLKKHGISEEQYGQLPADKRKVIDEEIRQAVLRATRAQAANRASMDLPDF